MRRLLQATLMFTVLATPGLLQAKEVHWLRTLGGPENDRVQAAASLGDRAYFAGVKDSAFPFSDAALLALSSDGDLIFEKVFTDPAGAPLEIRALAATDDTLFAAGNMGTFPQSEGAFVMALDPEGGILWQKILQSSQNEFLSGLLATEDGGVLAVGALVPDGDTLGNGWVLKLDADGTIQWQKEMGTRGSDLFSAAAPGPDGGYVLAGGIGSDDNPFFSLSGWLVSLDDGGNVNWQQVYGAFAGDAFNDVLVTRKGIWAFGFNCEFCFFRGDGWILQTDHDGNPLSATGLGDFSFQGFDDIVDVSLPAHGPGFFVLGSTDTITGGNFQEMWLARFGGRGTLRWMRQVGTSNFDQAGAMAVMPRGGVLFGGYTADPDNGHDMLFGKLDKNGRALGDCGGVQPLSTDLRDQLENIILGTRSTITEAPADAVASDGGIVEAGATSTPIDEVLCLE